MREVATERQRNSVSPIIHATQSASSTRAATCQAGWPRVAAHPRAMMATTATG